MQITQEMIDQQNKNLHDGLASLGKGIGSLKVENNLLFESLSLVTALLHDRNERDGGTETSLKVVADAKALLAKRYATDN